jgi:hypothetical protein
MVRGTAMTGSGTRASGTARGGRCTGAGPVTAGGEMCMREDGSMDSGESITPHMTSYLSTFVHSFVHFLELS